MNCAQVRDYLDDLLVMGRDRAKETAFAVHLEQCARCRELHDKAMATLAVIQSSYTLQASPELKERIMNRAIALTHVATRSTTIKRFHLPRFAWVAAAVVAIGISVSFLPDLLGPSRSTARSALGLYDQVWAAENALFSGEHVVHVASRIDVLPVADAEMAATRWFPIMSLDARGGRRFHQLHLSAAPGQAYAVDVNLWFDPQERRFARVLKRDGALIYADSFDGQELHATEYDQGRVLLKNVPIETGFESPKDLAALSGLLAGIQPPAVGAPNARVTEAGAKTLSDGSAAYLLDVRPLRDIPGERQNEIRTRLTVRKSDNTVVQADFWLSEKPMFRVSRVAVDQAENAAVGWGLERLDAVIAPAKPAQASQLRKDVIVKDLSVERMIAGLDFEPYILCENPAWTRERKITIVMSGVIVTYIAEDGRHVVLVQNGKPPRPKTDADRLIHKSQSGVSVWSTPSSKRNAVIAFMASRPITGSQPSDDCASYMVEMPGNLTLILAVNGQASESEIMRIADDLVPARQIQ